MSDGLRFGCNKIHKTSIVVDMFLPLSRLYSRIKLYIGKREYPLSIPKHVAAVTDSSLMGWTVATKGSGEERGELSLEDGIPKELCCNEERWESWGLTITDGRCGGGSWEGMVMSTVWLLGELLLQFKVELGEGIEGLGLAALAEEAAIGATSLEVLNVLLKGGLPPLGMGEFFLETQVDAIWLARLLYRRWS